MTMSWVQTWWQLLILIALMRFFGVGLIYVSAVRDHTETARHIDLRVRYCRLCYD